jgi:hypothetical protein
MSKFSCQQIRAHAFFSKIITIPSLSNTNNRFNSIKDFLDQLRHRPVSAHTTSELHIPLFGHDEEETIDTSQLTSQVMEMLRRSDPYSYFLIVTARMEHLSVTWIFVERSRAIEMVMVMVA